MESNELEYIRDGKPLYLSLFDTSLPQHPCSLAQSALSENQASRESMLTLLIDVLGGKSGRGP